MKYASFLCLVLVLASVACGDDTESGNPPGGSGPVTRTCPTTTTGPTTHSGYLSADETWTAATSPHRLAAATFINAGVTITVEPCARIEIGATYNFVIDGTLNAVGNADQPIVITSLNPASRFGHIRVRAPGSAHLEYVAIDGGVYDANQATATLYVEGSWPVVNPVQLTSVTISDSGGYGIYMTKWAGFAPGSGNLVITGSGALDADYPFPIRMTLNALNTVPTGDYTGNAADRILVVGESPHFTAEIDDTWHDRGVPYQVGGDGAFGWIQVYGAGAPTTTIEPGVEIQFYSDGSSVGGLYVGNGTTPSDQGRLVALGTPNNPITFTGVGTSAAGMWEGLVFWGASAVTSDVEYVHVDNAGAHGGDNGFGCPPTAMSDTDAAIKIFTQPGSSFVSNSTINNSSKHGVFSAWNGDEVDFVSGNTFSNVAWCQQVAPKSSGGTCDPNPDCQ